jgi:hypothetical protein
MAAERFRPRGPSSSPMNIPGVNVIKLFFFVTGKEEKEARAYFNVCG